MFSDLPADHILASHKRDVAEEEMINKSKPLTAFSSGIRIVSVQHFMIILTWIMLNIEKRGQI